MSTSTESRADPVPSDTDPSGLEGASLDVRSVCGVVPPPEALDDVDEAPPEARSLVGADLSGTELAAADLSGRDLSRADLSHAHLVGADLTGAILFEADLTGADLTGALLDGADLRGVEGGQARLSAASLVDARCAGANLEHVSFAQANLSKADLSGADLRGARMRDATLDRAQLARANLSGADLHGATIDHTSFQGADLRTVSFRGVRHYRTARFLHADVRDADFSGALLVRRQILDENYLDEFRTQSRLNRVLYGLWWLTSDCGRSAGRWAAFVFVLGVGFALAYTAAGVNFGPNATWFSPIYFSVVTLTTLGFGDIVPTTLTGQVLVIAEVLVGYVALGGLLALMTNKVARRAE